MSALIAAKGSCLCGDVTAFAKTVSPEVGACHCNMCRKWSGGPLMTVDCHTEVTFSGEESIVSYPSSEWAERGFCAKCGTHLFYKLTHSGQYIMHVELFDIKEQLHFDHQIFIDEKPDYYTFANETRNMTGEEVFAQFSPE